MVYIDPEELKWMPFVQTWMAEKGERLQQETRHLILDLFTRFVERGLRFISKKCLQAINAVDISKVNTLCKLLECLLLQKGGPDLRQDIGKLHPLVATTFVFCFVWAIGGNILDSYWDAFDTYTRQIFDECPEAKVNK